MSSSAALVLWSACLVWAHARILRDRIAVTDPWAVSRRPWVPWLIVPPVVCLAALAYVFGHRSTIAHPGYELSPSVDVGWLASDALGVDPYAEEPGDRCRIHVRVPPSAWRVHVGVEAPTVTAPWGETAALDVHPVFEGAPVGFYDPYDVAASSSVRFLAWQLTRAAREVHGVELSEAEAETRFRAAAMRRHDAGADESLRGFWVSPDATPFAESFPPSSTPRWRFGLFTLFLAGWGVIVLSVWGPSGPARTLRSWRLRRGLAVLLWVGPLALFVVQGIVTLADDALPTLIAVQAHLAVDRALGESALAWLLLDAVWLGALVAFLVRHVDRVEARPFARSESGWATKESD